LKATTGTIGHFCINIVYFYVDSQYLFDFIPAILFAEMLSGHLDLSHWSLLPCGIAPPN